MLYSEWPDRPLLTSEWGRSSWPSGFCLSTFAPSYRFPVFHVLSIAEFTGSGYGQEATEWTIGRAFNDYRFRRVPLWHYVSNPLAHG